MCVPTVVGTSYQQGPVLSSLLLSRVVEQQLAGRIGNQGRGSAEKETADDPNGSSARLIFLQLV